MPHESGDRPDGGARRSTYAFEPTPTPPALPGTVVLRPDSDSAMDALLEDLVAHAEACVREFGDFHLALPGGASTEPLLFRLMIDPRYRGLPWKRTHLWLMHEDIDTQAGGTRYEQMAELIVEHSDIPPEQAHPIPVDQSNAARAYEKELKGVLEWRERGHDRLDFALVDTTEELIFIEDVKNRLVQEAACASTDRRIISLTPRFLRASRFVSVLVTDRDSLRPAVRHGDKWPLIPFAGEMRWYVTHEACGD